MARRGRHEYTGVKLHGALGAFGQDGILPIRALMEGEGPATARSIWAARDHTRSAGRDAAAAVRPRSQRWWDRVVAALN